MNTWWVYQILQKHQCCQNTPLHSISLFSLSSMHNTNNTHFLIFTQNHVPLIIVSKLANKSIYFLWFGSSGIFQANRPKLAVTPVCTSSGEDASADMLYGDINLANHRANGESSWIERRTRLSQRVCSLCFSCLSHKALTERRVKPTMRGFSNETRGDWDVERVSTSVQTARANSDA